MSTYPHYWRGIDPYDGPSYYCVKCKRGGEGFLPTANNCPVSAAEHNAAAWLGQAGLYATRLDAVRKGEQLVEPISPADLVQHAKRHLHLTRVLGMGFKPTLEHTTTTPTATDAAIDQDMQLKRASPHD